MTFKNVVTYLCFVAASLCFLGAVAHPALGEESFASRSPSAAAFAELHATGNWTLKAKRALARALWGEAGILSEYVPVRLRNGRYSKHKIRMCSDKSRANGTCKPNRDWEVIPWVLLRRWEASHSNPSKRIAFDKLIESYSAPLKPHLASKEYERKIHKRRDMPEALQIQRRRFLQSLRYDGTNLASAYRRLRGHAPPRAVHVGWEAIKATVEAWGAGNVPDHCPRAQHWDMPGAKVSQRLAVTCKGTRNIFYKYHYKRIDS